MARGWIVAALLSAACGAKAESDAEPSAWLVDINEAARTSNYQGIVTYRSGDGLETMRITHRYQNGEEREHMMSMTGAPREILRRDQRVSVILPSERKVMIENQAPTNLFPIMSQDTVMALTRHYNFREHGAARVAERGCRVVNVTPQDAFRYGYEMCADEERKIPLRVSLIDRRGRILEQMMFSEITFPVSIPDAVLESRLDTRGFAQVTQQARAPAAGVTAWALQNLPPGFRLKMREVRSLPGAQGMIEHLLLSDGLSMVSIYSAARLSPQALQGLSNVGGVNAYGRIVGPFHVTVVGEVPEETVKMIGDGLVAPGQDAE